MSEAVAAGSSECAATTSGQTVLIIDDVPYLLNLASLFLGRTARVVTAEGGRAGLDAARSERPDLIVCDDFMPEIDGLELCRMIRRDPELGSTPFMMLLSDPGARARGAAIRAGADDVLAKPLARMPFVEAVSRFLRNGDVRGLPRIETNLPVTVRTPYEELQGRVRNISRGGAYVETDRPLVCADEVGLRFQLPDAAVALQPSAQVIWRRNRYEARPDVAGAGLRFVEIDAASAKTLDDFVYERADSTAFEGAAR